MTIELLLIKTLSTLFFQDVKQEKLTEVIFISIIVIFKAYSNIYKEANNKDE
jgi:hypothetical protein